MSEPHEAFHEIRLWIEKAENDLKAAEHILTIEEDCPFDTVCFHAQQCAEKYFKGVLVFKEVDFPKTHDLRLLMQLVIEQIPLRLEYDTVLKLNRYPIETRYPGDWEPISRDEAREAVSVARTVREEIRKHLPEESMKR
jgi:HEPN domain-containing protein